MLQLIWSEVCYEISDSVAQASSTTALTWAMNRSKNLGANRSMQTLSERTFTTCFPKCLDRKFHPSIPSEILKPYQYYQCKEHLQDPNAYKQILDETRHITFGGNLVHPIKRCKRTHDNISHCIPCNVGMFPQYFFQFS